MSLTARPHTKFLTVPQAAREMGMKRVCLDTNRALGEAHALYLAEGYEEIARYNDNPYADHWFARTL